MALVNTKIAARLILVDAVEAQRNRAILGEIARASYIFP
jgi:hypothetical protein